MGIPFKISIQQTSAISMDNFPNYLLEDVEDVIMSDPEGIHGTKNTGMAEVSQLSELPSIENDAPIRKGLKRLNYPNSLEDDQFEEIKEIMSHYGCPSFNSFYSKAGFQS